MEPIRQRIKEAREYRKKFEPTWESNMAYVSGKQWVVTERVSRQLRNIQEIDPRYSGRDLYTADRIGERRQAVLGELGSDDDRPELLTPLNDTWAEKYQAQLNRAYGFAWDYEFDGDEALAMADQYCVDLGTSAIRPYFDRTLGGVKDEQVPFVNGQPVPASQAVQLFDQFPQPQINMQDVPEGCIRWEVGSPWNILAPAGIAHEDDFPFDCWVAPVSVDTLNSMFPDVAGGKITDDKDITSSLGQAGKSDGGGKVKGQAWFFSYYERPTPKNPKGRVFYFTNNRMRFVGYDDQLPVCGPDEVYRSGIGYFHWQRITGRFYSRGLVDVLKDGQRAINNLRTDQLEIIRKGKPKVFMQKGQKAARTEVSMEVVEIDPALGPPTFFDGIRPGSWMEEMINSIDSDLEHASGIQPQSLGDAPSNVPNYAYLALLKESDQTKRQPTMRSRRRAIKRITEATVHLMRTYWGKQKQITLAGEEDAVNAEIFDATRIPPFFIVDVAKGSSKPRSQAAKLKMVEDIWLACQASGVIMQNPDGYLSWYKDSLAAGEPLDLPDSESNEQMETAELENHRMWQGEIPEVAYYDSPAVHVPVHRVAQTEARNAGRLDVYEQIEKHIQMHLFVADQNAQRQAQEQAQSQMQLDQQQALDAQGQQQTQALQDATQGAVQHDQQMELAKQQQQSTAQNGGGQGASSK